MSTGRTVIPGRNPELVAQWMGGTPGYQKHAIVRARPIGYPFLVQTPEGEMEGQPGDYLVSDADMTHAWPVRREVFEATYSPVAMTVSEAEQVADSLGERIARGV